MLETLKECPAPVLLILSGQDFVAREFLETARTRTRMVGGSGKAECGPVRPP